MLFWLGLQFLFLIVVFLVILLFVLSLSFSLAASYAKRGIKTPKRKDEKRKSEKNYCNSNGAWQRAFKSASTSRFMRDAKKIFVL